MSHNYQNHDGKHSCKLLKKTLEDTAFRLDCQEHEIERDASDTQKDAPIAIGVRDFTCLTAVRCDL
jgi:hypothetical protein